MFRKSRCLFFRGGALRANLDLAQVQKRIEIANYEKAIQVAFREVADGLAGRQTLDDQFRSEQLLVQASQANYELASQRFRAGIDDNLAELDAQRALFSAQQTLVQTRLARMSNLVNLYKALGADGQKALRLSHNSPGRLTPLSGDKVGNTWVEG